MNHLETALLGLTSPDPIKFDNSYDALLLDDDERLNTGIIDSIETNHNVPTLTKTLLQILCFRATQSKRQKRWCQRLQGTLIFGRYLRLLLDATEGVNPELKLEAIQCLRDIFEHNMSAAEISELKVQYPQAIYALCYSQAVFATIETLEYIANSDMDTNIQLLATSTLERIRKDYATCNRLGLVDNTHYTELERLERSAVR